MLTRSYTYLVPVLSKTVNVRTNFLENAYLGYMNTEPDQNIYCLWKYPGIEYEEYLSSVSNNIIDHDKETIISVIPFPDMNHYWKFVNGKYSEFSDENKQVILDFHGLDEGSDVWKIMYKYEGLYQLREKQLKTRIPRTQEIGELINFKKECISMS